MTTWKLMPPPILLSEEFNKLSEREERLIKEVIHSIVDYSYHRAEKSVAKVQRDNRYLRHMIILDIPVDRTLN